MIILDTNEYKNVKINLNGTRCPTFVYSILDGYIPGYYEAYWGSIGNYEEKGFGYAILHDAKVISECTSIFASEQFAEIDIATHNDYRGQGLAKIIAKIFINHSLKNNIIPRWDCDISNTTSIKLAKKLGFTNPIKYSIFT